MKKIAHPQPDRLHDELKRRLRAQQKYLRLRLVHPDFFHQLQQRLFLTAVVNDQVELFAFKRRRKLPLGRDFPIIHACRGHNQCFGVEDGRARPD